jgi:hypothetical protein
MYVFNNAMMFQSDWKVWSLGSRSLSLFGLIHKLVRRNRLTKAMPCGVTAWLMLVVLISQGQAQPPQAGDFYQPMHQNMPPGMAGNWAAALGKATPGYLQPIRVELPSRGSVTVYSVPGSKPQSLSAPAMIGFGVGYTYRLRIADMPEFPGVELYPSVEMLDQLHPPAGKAAEFPVPIQILRDEIEFVLAGRMVTKVIYLEQPNLAQPQAQPNSVLILPASRNLIAQADRIGRPMLILRIGGRLPDPRQPDPTFFGLGAPVRILTQATANTFGTLSSTNAHSFPVLNNQPAARLPGIYYGSNNESLQSRRDDRE